MSQTKPNADQPAFPQPEHFDAGANTGLTKREAIAAIALAGILSGWSNPDCEFDPSAAAFRAWAAADRLLLLSSKPSTLNPTPSTEK